MMKLILLKKINYQIIAMKKFLAALTLCFVSVLFAFAQIGELTPQEKSLEIKRALKNVSVVRDKSDNTYCLMIESDNQYEKKYALLLLGIGEQEALNSLVNLNKALLTPDQSFKVQDYTISTFASNLTHKNYAIVNTMGPLEFAAGSYMFEEEGLSNAMLIIIDKMEDFDFSNAVVKTTSFWGEAKSSIGITGIMCDVYIPEIGVHFVGGLDKANLKVDSKKFTKQIAPLAVKGLQWGINEYKIVINGIDNNLFSTNKVFFEKVCRLNAK